MMCDGHPAVLSHVMSSRPARPLLLLLLRPPGRPQRYMFGGLCFLYLTGWPSGQRSCAHTAPLSDISANTMPAAPSTSAYKQKQKNKTHVHICTNSISDPLARICTSTLNHFGSGSCTLYISPNLHCNAPPLGCLLMHAGRFMNYVGSIA
jgi:hypothetical protein